MSYGAVLDCLTTRRGLWAGLAALALGAGLPGVTAAQMAQPVQTATADGADLRVLDKINGESMDISLRNGAVASAWRINVELGECRYPVGNPAGDAYAFVTLRHDAQTEPVFRGWMVASSPALNALDHPRYDVWVIRCTTS